MSFEQDLALAAKFEPIQDRIYRTEHSIFTDNGMKIKRFDRDKPEFILDKRHHIDVLLETKNGSFTYQAKALRNDKYLLYGPNFTIEYEQNRFDGELGEYYHIISQYYLHGYSNENETDYEVCYIVNVPAFVNWSRNILDRCIKPVGSSNASMFVVPYADIPKEMCWIPKYYTK